MAETFAKMIAKEQRARRFSFTDTEQCVAFGRPDARMFSDLAEETDIVHEAIDAEKSATRSRVASFAFDTWLSLMKYSPKDSGYGGALEQEMLKRLRMTPSYSELRAETMGDDVAAMVGMTSLVRESYRNISKELQDAANSERRLKQEAEDAAQYADQLNEDEPGSERHEEAEREADAAAEKARRAEAALKAKVKSEGRKIQVAVAKAVEKAAEKASALNVVCRTFGNGVDEMSGGFGVEAKFKMAETLAKSNVRFDYLMKVLGRVVAEALRKQASKTQHEAGEIVDVTLGNDIASLVDDELVALRHPQLRRLALARLADEASQVHDVQMKETLGRGDVVVLLDESGSMSGEREAQAKAITLALVHVAMKQKRRVTVHFFQSQVTCTVDIKPSDAAKVDITGMSVAARAMVKIAERGTAGGTSFDSPLTEAMKQLAASESKDKADVLMITDGECVVSDDTLAAVATTKQATGARFYSMVIGTGTTEALAKFSDRIWKGNDLLASGALDLFDEV